MVTEKGVGNKYQSKQPTMSAIAELGHKAKKERLCSFSHSGVGIITLVYDPRYPEETTDNKTRRPLGSK